MEFDTWEISPENPVQETKWLFVVSPWHIIHDGINGKTYEYNVETKEWRDWQPKNYDGCALA